jgi:HPt (histidine-containing phosphotransfer) domain-containing protein
MSHSGCGWWPNKITAEIAMTHDALAASGRGVSGRPAIDRAVLGEWLDGDDDAINALLVLFCESICAEAASMHDLLAQDELVQFAHAAHRLRGAALSMGARALADFAGLLFTAALAKDRNACVEGIPMLKTLVRLVEAEVPASAASGGI